MGEPIRWGVLAAGGIARAMTKDLIATGSTVVAVGSRSAARAAAFAAEYGIPSSYGSYRELVADPAVDVVYIATPHPQHAGNALLALEAGKHVLVEKPFTLTGAEARRVAAAAERLGLVAQEAMWTRFLPHMIRIRQLIAAGAIGEPRALLADHSQSLTADPAHRINAPELGGGALLDLGVYPVSFAFDLFGQPERMSAISAPTATGVDRQTSVILRYAGGRQAVLHTALDLRGPNTAAILGMEGRIDIDATWYAPTSFTATSRTGEVIERYETTGLVGRGMHYQAAEVERLIRARRSGAGETSSPLLPLEESVRIMATLDAIRSQIGLSYPGEDAPGEDASRAAVSGETAPGGAAS